MKSKDVLTIVVVGIVSGVISIILSGMLFGSEKSRNIKVEVVPVISAEFERPSNEYFNAESINPSQTVQIGESASDQPFGGQ